MINYDISNDIEVVALADEDVVYPGILTGDLSDLGDFAAYYPEVLNTGLSGPSFNTDSVVSFPYYYRCEVEPDAVAALGLPTNSDGVGNFPYVYEWFLILLDEEGNRVDGAPAVMYRKVYSSPTYLFEPLYYTYSFSPVIDGRGVIWLYNFGSYLSSVGSSFVDILNFGIGDYNLIFLIAGGGFIVYVGWCIVKWFVPL